MIGVWIFQLNRLRYKPLIEHVLSFYSYLCRMCSPMPEPCPWPVLSMWSGHGVAWLTPLIITLYCWWLYESISYLKIVYKVFSSDCDCESRANSGFCLDLLDVFFDWNCRRIFFYFRRIRCFRLEIAHCVCFFEDEMWDGFATDNENG